MNVSRNTGSLLFASMLVAGIAVSLGTSSASAQQRPVERPGVADSARPIADQATTKEAKKVDIILPHISDGDEIDVPWFNTSGFRVVHLPHWAPVMIGGFALDLSPTKHVVMML